MRQNEVGVLHVILSPGGGAWSVVRELARWQHTHMPVGIGISYRRFQAETAIEEARTLGVEVLTYEVPLDFPNASALLLPPLRKWYNDFCTRYPSHAWVTHFHNGSGVGFVFWPRLHVRYSGPALTTFHGIPPEDVAPELRSRFGWVQTKVNGFLTRRMQHGGVEITTLSQALSQDLAKAYDINAKSVWVIPNGVPASPNRGCPRRMSSEGNLPPFTVGFVGRLEQNKRWDLVLDAISSLHGAGRPVRLLIAGDGPDAPLLRNRMQACGDTVQYLGAVPMAGQTVMPLLDVLALPSIREGQPMVILEAFACGVPVIASAVGGIPETVTAGKTGYLLDAPSSDELARHIGVLMDDPQLHREMSDRCLTEWEQRFSAQAMAMKYQEVYRSAIACHGAGVGGARFVLL
jgi:glycosyltransferase involved in cell wall biosynthesis